VSFGANVDAVLPLITPEPTAHCIAGIPPCLFLFQIFYLGFRSFRQVSDRL
jgi:hypothetical protein